jgi:photosystem II stability/assembly factor-like uncharacterized protein
MTNTKKTLLTLFFLLFLSHISFAQVVWEEILPWQFETSNDTSYYALNSLSSSNANNTTIVGYITHNLQHPNSYCSHLISRTTNGGISWNAQNSGLPNFFDQINDVTIEKVYAIDSLNIVAVGDSGLILRTTDAGNTWVNQGKHSRTKYLDVSFYDLDHGIAVGTWGTAAITSDGGKNWNVQELITYSIFDITKAYRNGFYYAFDKNYQHFFRTSDNGATWDSIQIVDKSLKDSLLSFIKDVHFFDSLNFIAVGGHQDPQGSGNTTSHYYIIKTSDGGNSWNQLIDSSDVKAPLYSVSFFDRMTGVASSAFGNLMFTADGGISWKKNVTDSLSGTSLSAVFYKDRSHIYVFNNRIFYSSLLLGTLNTEGVATNQTVVGSILSNYPNPFSSSTTVAYLLNKESTVQCIVQDILGRELQHIDLGRQQIGEHRFTINASQLIGGSYYYTIEAEGRRTTKQMILIK